MSFVLKPLGLSPDHDSWLQFVGVKLILILAMLCFQIYLGDIMLLFLEVSKKCV